jgi:serine/threonine-protein kinase
MMVIQGRYADAEPVLREAVAIRQVKTDQGSLALATARLELGTCLMKLGRPSEAKPLLAASYPVLQKERGEQHDLTRRARGALAQLNSR